MKITVTERGHQIIQSLTNDQSRNGEVKQVLSNEESMKSKRRLTNSMSLPTLSIEVKTPIIKISEPFKHKYDTLSPTFTKMTSITDQNDIPYSFKQAEFLIGKKLMRSDTNIAKRLEMKYRKIKQKHDFEKEKADLIINNIRRKIEGKVSVISEEKHVDASPKLELEQLLYETNYGNRRMQRIEMIHQLKYKSPNGTLHGKPHYKCLKYALLRSPK